MPSGGRRILAIVAGLLGAAVLATAARATVLGAGPVRADCGCQTGGPPSPPWPHQFISNCGYLNLHDHRGFVEVFYGVGTTPCRSARRVVADFWPEHALRHGSVGRFACTRYPKSRAIMCYGPHRGFAGGLWVKVALRTP